MKAWIASHRLNIENREEFRRRWLDMQRRQRGNSAYLLQSAEDPSEILSVTLCAADARFGPTHEAEAEPREPFADLAAERWGRMFEVWETAGWAGPLRAFRVLALPALAAATASLLVARLRPSWTGRQRYAVTRGGWKLWLLLPAAVAPVGALSFVLGRRLGGGPQATQLRQEEAGEPGGRPVVVETFSPAPAAKTASAAGGAPDQSRLRVRDVMTPAPETIEFDENLASAAEKMRSLDVGILPVVADGHVTGVITDRDLALAMSGGVDGLATQCVGDLMTAMPVTIRSDATVQEATQLMAGHQIRRLLVVDGANLVGILSLGDLAAEGADEQAQAALEEISEPAEPRR